MKGTYSVSKSYFTNLTPFVLFCFTVGSWLVLALIVWEIFGKAGVIVLILLGFVTGGVVSSMIYKDQRP